MSASTPQDIGAFVDPAVVEVTCTPNGPPHRQLQDVIDHHLAELTRSGLLPAEAIEAVLEATGLESYRFSVHVHNRDVQILKHERAWSNVGLAGRTLKYENCSIEVDSTETTEKTALLYAVLRHCQFIFLNTLVWRNVQKMRHRDLYEKLRRRIEERDDNVTIETLPKLIREEMGIGVEIVERVTPQAPATPYFVRRNRPGQSRADGVPISDPDLIAFIQNEALGRATTLDISDRLGVPAGEQSGPVIIVPLCRSSSRRSARSQLFLLHGKPGRHLTLEDVTTVEAVITFFLEEVLYNRQRAFLLDLIEEIIDASASDEAQLEDEYHRVLSTAITRIVTDTTAYRCSVWWLDHQYSVIRAGEMATYEQGVLQTEFDVAKTRIRARDHQRSSIAYVMAGAEGDGHLLINNCNDPRLDLRNKNIENIITPTGETQSELAVQIRQYGIPHSVLLAESRLDRGFESDVWYIRAVCALLSEFRRTLHQRLDSSYITERLSVFDNSHDLDVFIDMNLREVPDVADRLRKFLRIGTHDLHDTPRDETFDLAELSKSIKGQYSMLDPAGVEAIFARLLPNQLPALSGSPQFKRAMIYILKNLISNAFRYDQSTTTIGARIEPATVAWAGSARKPDDRGQRISQRRILKIETIITPALPEDIERQIGRRSIMDAKRGGRRGLYLVGLIVRQLSGIFEVHRTSDNTKTKFVIRIPVETVEGERECLVPN